MSVRCKCCVLSGRGLCDELITRPEEYYRLCCVVVCDLDTSRMRRPWPALGLSAMGRDHDLVHSVSSQNETPHFGIPNLLFPTAQQKQERLVLFSQFGLTFDIITMDERC